MKRNYENAELEVIAIANADVITTSGGKNPDNDVDASNGFV